MSGRWQAFSTKELAELRSLVPEFGTHAPAQTCPSCGESRLHWYDYPNPHRAHTTFSYVWCGACRRFQGQTSALDSRDLPDPLADCSTEERLALTEDLTNFFATLDRLWYEGELPQVRAQPTAIPHADRCGE